MESAQEPWTPSAEDHSLTDGPRLKRPSASWLTAEELNLTTLKRASRDRRMTLEAVLAQATVMVASL